MRLFQTNQNLMVEPKASLVLNTPLGRCICEYQLHGRNLPDLSRMEQTEKGVLLVTWAEPSYQMECLRTPFQPALPSNMHVDGCFAFIWRVLVKNKASVSWKISLATSSEGSCETGENLVSCTFAEKAIALSIGTEDEEGMIYRAEKNLWMPDHLKDRITEKNVQCLSNGLEICFDQLLPNDYMQIHFLIAWSSAEKRAISTWTAVEQSCINLLQQTGFF
jgi:hypothetical protein